MSASRGGSAAVLGADGAILRTFQQVEDEAQRLGHGIGGLAPGSIVAVRIGNSPSWPAVFLALLRAGHITLPLSAGITPPPFANALLHHDLRYEALATRHSPLPGIAVLKLTSGTTAEPRAIRFTAAQIAADCEQVCDTMGITDADVCFGAIPIAHSYGFSNLLTPLLLRGVPFVATEDRLPRAMLDGLLRSGATVFPGTPVFFQHLAALDTPRLPRLRLCISAGAPLGRGDWQRFRARFGLGIHTFYGSSECGGIAYDRPGLLVEEGAVGEPMCGVQIEPRADGRIDVRSAAVGDGYFPEEDADALGGGRFVPGDLVRMGASGLVIEGRANDVINVAGRKLNPLEVERRLAAFPGVRDAVVFGVASPVRGEEPMACIVGEGIDVRALLRHCGEALPAWQVPRDVWLVAELPLSERGKISRRALAAHYTASRKP